MFFYRFLGSFSIFGEYNKNLSDIFQNPRKISQFQVAYSDDECETSTQKSSAIDTTDLDSGQESSTQDSGISEQSDNNEPPSKTSKSGNSLLENGTGRATRF